VGQALDRVKEALKAEDAAAIESATENLQTVWGKAAASLYQQASSQTPPDEPPAGGGPGKKPGGDDAVDADFEVVP
jgi:molecular chaperone DnaK